MELGKHRMTFNESHRFHYPPNQVPAGCLLMDPIDFTIHGISYPGYLGMDPPQISTIHGIGYPQDVLEGILLQITKGPLYIMPHFLKVALPYHFSMAPDKIKTSYQSQCQVLLLNPEQKHFTWSAK